MIRRRVVARGQVQGVFFRDTMRRKAVSRGVAGWVRNRADGAVEAVLEGDPEAVESMLAFAGEGPDRAHVSDLEVTDEEPEGLEGFTVA